LYSRAEAPVDSRIRTAFEIIDARFHERLTLKTLSVQVGLSRSHFRALFKKDASIPFKAHLVQLRLTRASHLLATTEMQIKEVASCVGYRYAPNFARDFKKHFGQSPSQFRRQSRPQPSEISHFAK
jgi:AraC-like DNA-binding protein